MSKITKNEFIDLVVSKTGLKKVDTVKTLDAIFDVISESLAKGDEVSFVGFGSFGVIERSARDGRNPRTGKEIKIPAKKAPVFRAGKILKDSVSGL